MSMVSFRSSPERTPFSSIFISCPPISNAMEKEMFAVGAGRRSCKGRAVSFECIADLHRIAVHARHLSHPLSIDRSGEGHGGNKHQSYYKYAVFQVHVSFSDCLNTQLCSLHKLQMHTGISSEPEVSNWGESFARYCSLSSAKLQQTIGNPFRIPRPVLPEYRAIRRIHLPITPPAWTGRSKKSPHQDSRFLLRLTALFGYSCMKGCLKN